jgi:hypothetical protein
MLDKHISLVPNFYKTKTALPKVESFCFSKGETNYEIPQRGFVRLGRSARSGDRDGRFLVVHSVLIYL